MKLVSIIIPVFNREKLIAYTLDSIIEQTYPHWECIVVDDGSTDNTRQVVQSYANRDERIKLYSRIKPYKAGGCGARNYGYSLSKGEYINWFDSDDIMLPEKLQVQVAHLNESPWPMTVCQTLVFEDTIGNTKGLRCENIYAADFFNAFILNKIKWLTQAPLIRKSFIEEFNFAFNEDLMRSQERQYFVDILSKIQNYHFDDTPLVLYREHANRISTDQFDIRKLKSTFDVDFYILHTYSSLLTIETIAYLSTNLFRYIEKLIQMKEYKEMRNALSRVVCSARTVSWKLKFKLLVGVGVQLLTGKGYRFFKA